MASSTEVLTKRLSKGLLEPEEQSLHDVSQLLPDYTPKPIPLEFPFDRPIEGSQAYSPPNPELLEMFPHESTFGQGLSSKYVFPMQRHGSTGPVIEHADTATSKFGSWESGSDVIDLYTAPPPPNSYWHNRGELGIGPEGYRVLPAYPTQWQTEKGYRYGLGSLDSGHMGFKSAGRRILGHHERIPSFEERRESYRQKMIGTSKHEAGHRYHRDSIAKEEAQRYIEEEIGQDKYDSYWRPYGTKLSKEDEEKIRNFILGGKRTPDHEVIYLLDWVDSKLRGHTLGIKRAQHWLNLGEESLVEKDGKYTREYPNAKDYDIVKALQPGTDIRKKIERWNDDANQRLISEGRPPILNYKDYIDEAIGYKREKKKQDSISKETYDKNLLKTLQEVGGI